MACKQLQLMSNLGIFYVLDPMYFCPVIEFSFSGSNLCDVLNEEGREVDKKLTKRKKRKII